MTFSEWMSKNGYQQYNSDAEYRAIVTDDHNISTTPTYNIGKYTLNYLNY